MKNKWAIAVSAAVLLSACGQTQTNLSPEDIAALKKATEQWVETYNRNDWQALADHFTQDAVMMPPFSPAVKGRAAIAAWEKANEDGFRISFKVEDISGAGDIAIIRGRSCVFIPLGDGSWGVDVGKYLETRQRMAGGRWLITADAFNSDQPASAKLAETCPFQEQVPAG